MKGLRAGLDRLHPLFAKGGKFEKYYAVYEMIDTFFYSPPDLTRTAPHVRDGIDLKRVMIYVWLAAMPCLAMACWNTGLQANTALAAMGLEAAPGWRGALLDLFRIGYDPTSIWANFWHGFWYYMPVYMVTFIVGGIWEVLFATVRNHEVNEGFFVTSILFSLTLPATIPLWQVALGISFGVVIGKEVFGGTGKNFLNPALTGRAFLFFAYPAQMSGDAVWVAADGFTGATPLSMAAAGGIAAVQEAGVTWSQSFLGTISGSMGETSTVACLIGAAFLLYTRVASWRIIAGVLVGAIATSLLLNVVGSDSNPMFAMPWYWHVVLGGFAFGAIYMATDPVSASMTNTGRWIFGALIGFMTIMIRVINPAFPEGVMLAILFANIFAPLIDYFVVQSNVRRRKKRLAMLEGSVLMRKDSTFGTLFVALAVCLVCSIFVSTAAVYLKPLQETNKALDKKKNILAVAGLMQEGKTVDELFSQVEPRVVELATGEFVNDIDPASFDARKAAKDPAQSVAIPGNQDIASIRSRAKYATVYFVKEGERAGLMIIPVHGYALWSTLYGFVALERDGQTVYGLSFYEHAETPGLGGEIDNPKWKSLWRGKQVFDEQGSMQLQVVKGVVTADTPLAEHKVDGLAGATLTSVGVSNLLAYWLSDQGFGPFLDKVRTGS